MKYTTEIQKRRINFHVVSAFFSSRKLTSGSFSLFSFGRFCVPTDVTHEKISHIASEDYHEGMQFVKLIVTILENNSPYFEYIAVLPKQVGCKKHRLRILDMPNLKTNPQKLSAIPIFATIRIRPDFTVKRTFFFRNQDGCCQIFLVKLKFVAFKKSAPFDSQNASIVRH